MTGREQHLVELVDDAGRACGTLTVEEAHREPGRLHRAFSVQLVDPAGRLLLQRRAEVKTRFPLRWANACCGHPAPGQTPVDAAGHRLVEELGVTGVELHPIAVYRYRATDPATGRVEHEFDHVLVGRVPEDLALRPDPAEVADVRWVDPADLRRDLAAEPDAYAPWLAGVSGPLWARSG
ncbi:isopentenyl-diphosphate Delta-isomerase [Rhizomonospora bruguierae]|uniref:isopentenyl-diphosphate Delta-isomerase n=1 Tax=Rhizomonospora bruguierae TaxID=1581705 RepID=UPI001BCDFD55|nr:isopentenyl-diphosphate Delta-isomerase [Micromonospora sp. NBRC 107566]